VRALIHPLDGLSDAQIGAWRALAANAVEPNPFFEPEFLLPAARRLAGETGLLTVDDGDGWAACMPVVRVRFAGMSPVIGTWRHQYCFLGTPLVDRSQVESATAALVRYPLHEGRALVFMAEALSEGPVLTALRGALDEQRVAVVFERHHERAALHRRDDGVYTANMRSHHRRELQRLWRRLEGDLGEELEVQEGGSAEQFLELEAAGWKGQSATALAANPEHATFFRELCGTFASEGRLQMLTLKAGERVIAMKCNLAAGDALFCFKIAYDETLSRYSPGVQLERMNVNTFHESRDERFMDSCAAPDNKMINRLWPDRRSISHLVLSRRGPRSAVSRQGLRAADAVRTARKRRTESTRS
jgi:CelD/BcsL family acetyltransferase involved in cellulose biosynthesis